MNNHLAQCTDKTCPKHPWCKRYMEEPTRPIIKFKWLYKNRGFKCFVYKKRDIKEIKKDCK